MCGLKYRPRGSMCIKCIHKYRHCIDYLKFRNMPVISIDKDNVRVVKCTGYVKENS